MNKARLSIVRGILTQELHEARQGYITATSKGDTASMHYCKGVIDALVQVLDVLKNEK